MHTTCELCLSLPENSDSETKKNHRTYRQRMLGILDVANQVEYLCMYVCVCMFVCMCVCVCMYVYVYGCSAGCRESG
jgi:hypothetical protein